MTAQLGLLRRPITWIVAAALAAAVFVFQDFGLTWDEPLFYQYADALGYAYTPENWVSGHFDLGLAYGPSADDHKTRGPGYLLLAREPSHLLQAAGLSAPAAWHLVNSITFVLGVFFIYGLSRRLAGELAATLGAALFASQPLLWGHAFINPKDVPFMVFFSGAVWLGWRMVDRLAAETPRGGLANLGRILMPAILLGLATSNRVLGPLAGFLVVLYWIARGHWREDIGWMLAYSTLGAAVMLATWPYLWEDPLNIFGVFALMAQNPTVLQVLFDGQVYHADQLPLRYLPFYLAITLTEPVWPLVAIGTFLGWPSKKDGQGSRLVIILLLMWLILPVAYVLILHPPMYDGMRHFLFILPPAFVLAAAGIDVVLHRLQKTWILAAVAATILFPGILGIVQLHPYEYTYFNALVGGTGGAFRRYETDYWLTCYKEAVENLRDSVPDGTRLFVHREPAVAEPYGAPHLTIEAERGQRQNMGAGDYVLISSRTNEDLRAFRDAPETLSVGRMGATFCVVRRLP